MKSAMPTYKGLSRPHLSMICPAMGENNAMIMLGIVSINLERNSMLGMSEKVWLMSGKDETMVMPDMMPSVATMRSAICRFLFCGFVMEYDTLCLLKVGC